MRIDGHDHYIDTVTGAVLWVDRACSGVGPFTVVELENSLRIVSCSGRCPAST